MGTYRRIAGLVGAGCCVVVVTACGELLNARVNTADGSPSVDANGTNNNGDSNTPAVDSNTPAVDSNTPAVDSNTPATDSNTPATDSNTPAMNGNTPTGTTPAKSIALANGCTQATVTYASGASSLISSRCTACHSGGQPPNLSGYANAKAGFSTGGGIESIQGASPAMPMGSKLTATQSCTLFNWADNNYAQ